MRKIPQSKPKRFQVAFPDGLAHGAWRERLWKTRFVQLRWTEPGLPKPFVNELYYGAIMGIAPRKKDGRLIWRGLGGVVECGVEFDERKMASQLEMYATRKNYVWLGDSNNVSRYAAQTPVHVPLLLEPDIFQQLTPTEQRAAEHYRLLWAFQEADCGT